MVGLRNWEVEIFELPPPTSDSLALSHGHRSNRGLFGCCRYHTCRVELNVDFMVDLMVSVLDYFNG